MTRVYWEQRGWRLIIKKILSADYADYADFLKTGLRQLFFKRKSA